MIGRVRPLIRRVMKKGTAAAAPQIEKIGETLRVTVVPGANNIPGPATPRPVAQPHQLRTR
jgi:hypothetical protein